MSSVPFKDISSVHSSSTTGSVHSALSRTAPPTILPLIPPPQLGTLKLPDHWMRRLFLAHTYLELQLNDEALEIYTSLQDAGLANSTYIMAQVAITHHNQRGEWYCWSVVVLVVLWCIYVVCEMIVIRPTSA